MTEATLRGDAKDKPDRRNGVAPSELRAEPGLPAVQSLPAEIAHEKGPGSHRNMEPQRSGRLPATDYSRLAQGIRRMVNTLLPPGAVVAVISKGDSQLVRFKKRIGWHFPQEPDGRYAGYYPADSKSAIQHLDALRTKGAGFLVIPSTAFWWFDHYTEFGNHLQNKFRKVWSDEHCRIYQVGEGTYTPPKIRVLFPKVRPAAAAPEPTAAPSDKLQVAIDSRIPKQLMVGEGSGFYIAGWCYHANAKIRRLEIVCNGATSSLAAWGIPRPDVKAAHFPHQDPFGRSLRSGFWGLVPVTKVTERTTARLLLRATLSTGSIREKLLAEVVLEPGINRSSRVEPGPAAGTGAVAICMATHNPPLDLFKRQIESIRHQTFSNWTCIITDDGSRPDLFEKACGLVGKDSRFRIYRSQTGVGFYQNFERCLSLAPDTADFVALSDHDDFWHPNKLEELLAAFDSETSLAYSDMRIVDESGRELSPTYWTSRPNNFTQFASLLMANTITGGACLFRRNLLRLILPFPERIGEAYHDHWIGVVALAIGNIKYVNRALYDYVQHGANVIGHYAPQKPMSLWPASTTIKSPAQFARETLAYWQRVYFADLLRVQLLTQILQLRCGKLMGARKTEELQRIQKLGNSWSSLLWLAGRALAGWNRITETVNAERPLLGATLWRHSAGSQWQQQIAADPVHKAASVTGTGMAKQSHSSVSMIREKIAPLSLKITVEAPRRLNLLIPTIDLQYFFGGYITKFNLARQLAHDGLKVRLVVVDHCDWQPAQWRHQLKKFNGLEQFFDRVEVAYACDRTTELSVSPEDVFMATTWWTAHIAHKAARALGASRFVYLIQEYEPFTFAMGSFSALANQSYEFPHLAVFSTELLRTYFRENRLGVFAETPDVGAANSVAFENAITDVGEVTAGELAQRTCKRLLYYARPEPHAARNMFELGILALAEAIEAGYFDETWEFYGIGSVGSAEKLSLPKGRVLSLLPRDNQEAYRDILRAHDIGLALMYTPHPSLVPIEMASAGMLVVTTTCANKTRAELAKISPNLIAAHPSIERIKLGLKEATERVTNFEARAKGSRVQWATSWAGAFNPAVKAKIHEFIQASRAGTSVFQLSE